MIEHWKQLNNFDWKIVRFGFQFSQFFLGLKYELENFSTFFHLISHMYRFAIRCLDNWNNWKKKSKGKNLSSRTNTMMFTRHVANRIFVPEHYFTTAGLPNLNQMHLIELVLIIGDLEFRSNFFFTNIA